jgi:uncharacterized protein (TIGR02453 family)
LTGTIVEGDRHSVGETRKGEGTYVTAESVCLTPDLFLFLEELQRNNDREWFRAEKRRYEAVVREPLLAFVRAFEKPLEAISRHVAADDRKVGGSLFRIHRDMRFSKDRSPYKTWAALQFRHEAGKDVHAPGFYLHLAPENVFMGAGCWHPDREALETIRDAIVESPEAWAGARRDLEARGFRFAGDSLKRPPRGYPPNHPAIDDLKRKDFIVIRDLTEEEACRPDFLPRFADLCASADPLMRFLTRALGVCW